MSDDEYEHCPCGKKVRSDGLKGHQNTIFHKKWSAKNGTGLPVPDGPSFEQLAKAKELELKKLKKKEKEEEPKVVNMDSVALTNYVRDLASTVKKVTERVSKVEKFNDKVIKDVVERVNCLDEDVDEIMEHLGLGDEEGDDGEECVEEEDE